MADESGAAATADHPPGWPAATAEILAITLIFAATAAWPVPDVNEAVYITKARHRVDPDWAVGDFFLQTPDGHGLFFLLFGPVAAALPLATAAWVGRLLGWVALAAGFRAAVRPLVPVAVSPSPGASRAGMWRGLAARFVAAGLFAVAARTTTMAGEWVLGGCEAKVFAWAAVFAGIGGVARWRPAAAIFWFGLATAMHPLVGGWAAIALALVTAGAWLMPRREAGPPEGGGVEFGRGDVALVLGGLLLAAVGLAPALGLSSGVDAGERAVGIRAYVVERLHHHLLPRTFPEAMVARHVLAIVVWWLLARLAGPLPARRRVDAFTAAAVGLAAAGWAIAATEPFAPTVVLGLLRYYWFRLADIMVPFSLAVAAAAIWADDEASARLLPGRPWLLRAAVVGLLVADLALQSRHWPWPGGGPPPRADAHVRAADWAEICDWVRAHTPADAVFLTPRGAATFTWRTDRAEVVSWKNSPQDPRSLAEWRRRILDCFSADGRLTDMARSTATLGAARLREVADRYGATFAIVPAGPGLDELPWKPLHANGGYAVLDLR
jgi:hypothetical protein